MCCKKLRDKKESKKLKVYATLGLRIRLRQFPATANLHPALSSSGRLPITIILLRGEHARKLAFRKWW
jgi:hypothetical protein